VDAGREALRITMLRARDEAWMRTLCLRAERGSAGDERGDGGPRDRGPRGVAGARRVEAVGAEVLGPAVDGEQIDERVAVIDGEPAEGGVVLADPRLDVRRSGMPRN
jgi:hypothetical protein